MTLSQAITAGPSQWDLMQCVFDTKRIKFTMEDGTVVELDNIEAFSRHDVYECCNDPHCHDSDDDWKYSVEGLAQADTFWLIKGLVVRINGERNHQYLSIYMVYAIAPRRGGIGRLITLEEAETHAREVSTSNHEYLWLSILQPENSPA